MFQFGPMTEKDIPAALALWQGMPGIGACERTNLRIASIFLGDNPNV
jgi:hypothetical protein